MRRLGWLMERGEFRTAVQERRPPGIVMTDRKPKVTLNVAKRKAEKLGARVISGRDMEHGLTTIEFKTPADAYNFGLWLAQHDIHGQTQPPDRTEIFVGNSEFAPAAGSARKLPKMADFDREANALGGRRSSDWVADSPVGGAFVYKDFDPDASEFAQRLAALGLKDGTDYAMQRNGRIFVSFYAVADADSYA